MAKESIKLTTPRGVASYPSIHRKDMKFAEGDELEGLYKADIALDADTAAPLIKRLQEIHKEFTGKAAPASKNSMFEKEVDRESGEETGRIIIKARVKDKELKSGDIWHRQPKVFDARGQIVKPIPAIGGGSEIKLQVEVYCWQTPAGKKGVSLQPLSVQLLKLVERGNQDVNPFDEEPDAEFFADEYSDDESPFDSDDQDNEVPDSANF